MKPEQRLRIRFLLTFLSGILVAVLAATAASVGSSAATRYEELSLFTNVLTLVRRNYVEPVDERRLVRGAVRGMLSELDPHSSFMDADAFADMQVDTKGEFHGLGIEISKTRDGYIEVVSPIEGTPADRAGIKARDQIVSICPTEKPEDWDEECRSTKSMTLFEAVNLMRGRKDTQIRIDIFREGFEKPETFTVTRDVVKVVSVSGRMLEPGYGYVRIRAFQERTGSDLKRVLEELRADAGQPLGGLVIDLRDNPGGLLNQAVQVADTWLADGLVVYTKGRVDGQRQEFRADAAGTEPAYPITVIVNEGSASASEIVAGALQDQHRALVVGKKSFGKGSVQTVYPLEGGNGLRLTTALYYTPGGRSIQEVGIVPDIAVDDEPPVEVARAEGARRVREADLEGHFTHEDADPSDEGEARSSGAAGSDVQLVRALEVLKSWTYFDRLRNSEKPSTLHAQSKDEEPKAATR
ncbi:MAG: S41 family peptidase [Gaiellales bacterium]